MRGYNENINIMGDSLRHFATFDESTAVQPRGSKMNHMVKPWLNTVYGTQNA